MSRHPLWKLLDGLQQDLRALEAELDDERHAEAFRSMHRKLIGVRSFDLRHVPTTAEVWECDLCSAEFQTEQRRDRHRAAEHPSTLTVGAQIDPDGIRRARELIAIATRAAEERARKFDDQRSEEQRERDLVRRERRSA